MENIRFTFVTKDGTVHPINVAGVNTLLDAAMELISSILNGDTDIKAEDIVQITDVPG